MRESDSVASVFHGLAEAVRKADGEAAVTLHSRAPGMHVIGTDEDEWLDFDEFAAYARGFRRGYRLEIDEVRGYEEGDVGWFAARFAFVSDGGKRTAARMTGVVHREAGEWRFVQRHVSFGQS